MRRFKFRLQSLLDFRERQKEQAQAKTAAAEQQLQQSQQLLQQLDAELVQSAANFYQQQHNKAISINTFKVFNNYLDKIKREITAQQDKVYQAETYYAACRRELNVLSKNCKLIEQIKDKGWQDYKHQMLAEEQKTLDELGLQAYVRASS